MEVGPVAETGARWLEYDASRDRKGWARNQRDAVGWLIACVRREQREAKTGVRPRNASEITKQPTDPTAPWLQDDYVGKKTGT
jgi:hypothetical protein